MPSDRQAEIQARVNRATPGRWRFMVVQKPRRGENYPPDVLQTTQVAATYIGHQVRTDHSGGVSPVFDGEFIAHAREDIPWLLAELSRVQQERDEALRERDDFLRGRITKSYLLERAEEAEAERDALQQEIATLKGAQAADDARLRAAAERAEVVYVGCDTPDALAEEIATLRQQIETVAGMLASEAADCNAAAERMQERGNNRFADPTFAIGEAYTHAESLVRALLQKGQ